MSVHRLDSQARDSSQTLSCSFERNSWNTGSLGCTLAFHVPRVGRDVSMAPSSSWVPFRWSSFPVTPGGQSLREKLPNMWAPSVSSDGSSAWFSLFWFHFKWLPSGMTQSTQRIQIMATVICGVLPQGHRCEALHQEHRSTHSSESRTLSKLTKPLCRLPS